MLRSILGKPTLGSFNDEPCLLALLENGGYPILWPFKWGTQWCDKPSKPVAPPSGAKLSTAFLSLAEKCGKIKEVGGDVGGYLPNDLFNGNICHKTLEFGFLSESSNKARLVTLRLDGWTLANANVLFSFKPFNTEC